MKDFVFTYTWHKYHEFNTGMIPAKNFNFAMKKLERIYHNSPFEVKLLNDGIAHRVRM